MENQTTLSLSDLGEVHKKIFRNIGIPVVHARESSGDLAITLYNRSFIEEFTNENPSIENKCLSKIIKTEEKEFSDPTPGEALSVSQAKMVTTENYGTYFYRRIPYEVHGLQYSCILLFDVDGWDDDVAGRDNELEQFVSVLTHDLRNPIQIAKGWITTIGDEDTEDSEAVDRALRALDRVESMIDKTISVTKQREITGTADVLPFEKLCKKSWRKVESKDCELIINDEFNILCDEEMTISLLENTFQNAVIHNDTPITVEVGIEERLATSTRDGSHLEAVYIRDDGRGIPPDEKERLLEHGETKGEDRQGIGFSTISSVADAHDWDLELKNEYGVDGLKIILGNVSIHGTIPSDKS